MHRVNTTDQCVAQRRLLCVVRPSTMPVSTSRTSSSHASNVRRPLGVDVSAGCGRAPDGRCDARGPVPRVSAAPRWRTAARPRSGAPAEHSTGRCGGRHAQRRVLVDRESVFPNRVVYGTTNDVVDPPDEVQQSGCVAVVRIRLRRRRSPHHCANVGAHRGITTHDNTVIGRRSCRPRP